MSKQDRVYPRKASDLEQKYNFGKSFAEAMGLAEDAMRTAEEAKKTAGEVDENLTSEEIFNRLTNNGDLQGLYRGDDGDLYVNANYIKSGEIDANIVKVKNLTVDAAQIKSGTIDTARIPELSADKITSGTLDSARINGGTLNITKGAKIAGWDIDSNSVYKGSPWGKSTFMCSGSSGEYEIGGSPKISGWVFGSGGKYGVTKDGALYCNDAHLTGEIAATGGSIGSWNVGKTNFGNQYTDVECLWGVSGEEETDTYQKVGLTPSGLYFSWYDNTPGFEQYVNEYIRWADLLKK